VTVYFKEVSARHRYVPRATLIDLEPATLDTIRNSSIGAMFAPDNFVFGSSGAGNNWAKGHYTDGAELADEATDIIRRETESCDCPQGFQITHSLGGGTGSGLGTLLLLRMRDHFPDRITCTFSVFPSTKVSDVVVEPYNAIFSIQQLLENSDETFVIDNESLFKISHNILKQPDPKYADLNYVISLVMSGITSSLRFSGKLNGDLRKMGVNLVPYPRLHFFLVSQAPLFAPGQAEKVRLCVDELMDQMWSPHHFLANVDGADGKFLTAAVIFRGAHISTQEIEDSIQRRSANMKLSDEFVSWIPNNIKSSLITVAPENVEMSSTFVANSTALKNVFQRICHRFGKMYKRKAFVHWYSAEGMDDMEFQEADKNVRDLISEYQDKQDVQVLMDDESDDDDDDNDDDESENFEEEEEDTDDDDDESAESY
jgi:tubulin beta